MKKLIKDRRGGGSLELCIAVILLMFIYVSTMEPVVMTYKQLVLEQAKMKGLDAMQIKGGLTSEIETAICDYLKSRGFNVNQLTINGTIAPINWGGEVAIDISYNDTIRSYHRRGLITFERESENITYHVTGSTTSYYYDNN